MNAPQRVSDWPMQAESRAEFRHVTVDRFKAGMRRVVQPVAIATFSNQGVRGGLTISSFCSLSAEPPRMIACISRAAGAYPLIVAGGNMAINVLAESRADLAMRFSSSTLKGEERFNEGEWHRGQSGAPVLAGTRAVFEGRIVEISDTGSHAVLVLDVLAVCGQTDEDALLYADGGFTTVAGVGANA